jgi:hypothetical protein
MRKFLKLVFCCALVAGCIGSSISALADGSPPPALSQIKANPAAVRSAIGSYPSQVNMQDPAYGAAGDALRAWYVTMSVPTGTNPELSFLAGWEFDNATVNCVNGSNSLTTITLPNGVIPPSILNGSSSYRIGIASCPGLTNANFNSISGSAPGPYTISTDNSATANYSGTSTVFVRPTSFGGAASNTQLTDASHFYHYGPGTIAGTTLTMPTGTFNTQRDLTQAGPTGLTTQYIVIDDPAGVCPQYRGRILSNTSNSVVPAAVASGPTLAGHPWSCELLKGGASGVPTTLPVGAYIDPFHVTLTGALSTAMLNTISAMTCGTPDDAALNAAAVAAFNSESASVFLPPGHNYFDTTGSTTNIAQVSWCADGFHSGRIYWTALYPSLVNATRCTPSRGLPTARKTINPKVHLAHSLTVTGRPVVAALLSDSLMENGTNGMGDAGSGAANLWDWLSVTLGKPVTFDNFSIGGTELSFLAPNMAVNSSGVGIGIPTSAQQSEVPWYTSSSTKWINYALAQCPDVVFLEFQNDLKNLLISNFYDVNGYLNTAWKTSCGFSPDIIWITGPGQSASFYSQASNQEASFYQQDFIRTAVLAGDTMPPGVTMGNGGAVGLLDFAGRYNTLRYGLDNFSPPMTRAIDIFGAATGVTNDTNAIGWPFSWPRPVRDFQFQLSLFDTTSTNITSSTFWNTYLAGAWNIPLGAGSVGTPYSSPGQSSPSQTAYPNNMLSLSRDSGGNIGVTGYTYRLAESASCSMTTTTLTCATPVANAGYYYSNIIIQGAGSAACPADIGGSTCLYTTIAPAGVSANGEVVTTVASGTLASSNVALVIYRTFLPYTVSPVSAAINNGSDGSPACSPICGLIGGMGARVVGPFAEVGNSGFSALNPIFQGPVVRFGSRFVPAFTAGPSGATTTTNNNNDPTIFQDAENADDMTTATPVFLDGDCWGSPPGYVGPQGGGYSAHMASDCMRRVLGDVLAANTMSVWDIPSGGTTVVATTGGTSTVPNGATWMNVTPAATIATYTFVMPASPMPNQPVTFSTTQTITALTVNANTGQTINGAPTTLAANAAITFRWDQQHASWNRIQ